MGKTTAVVAIAVTFAFINKFLMIATIIISFMRLRLKSV